eukprot:101190_1
MDSGNGIDNGNKNELENVNDIDDIKQKCVLHTWIDNSVIDVEISDDSPFNYNKKDINEFDDALIFELDDTMERKDTFEYKPFDLKNTFEKMEVKEVDEIKE